MELQQPIELVQSRVEGWVEALIQNLPNLAVAILLLVAGWFVAKLVRKGVRRGVGHYTDNQDLTRLAGTLAGIGVILTAGFVALGVLHLEKTVTTLLAGAGVIGLALGFAFQDTAANLISGIAMALRKPFDEGDLVDIGGDLAVVERIDLRTTVLRRLDGPMVMIPNKTVFQNRIVNYSEGDGRRVELDIGVSYADDLERAREIALESVDALECVDRDRPIEFYWKEFGGSSINGVLRFWIERQAMPHFLEARSKAVMGLKNAFDEADITIPFPIRTLDFGIEGGRTLAQMMEGVAGLRMGSDGTADTRATNASTSNGQPTTEART